MAERVSDVTVSTAGGGVLRREPRIRRISFASLRSRGSSMKAEYTGTTCTEKYLTVYFTAKQDTWVQFCSVKVPLTDLLDEKVTNMMDRAVRRKLIEIWSEVDLADPLF
jgi:hypothetical protein